MFWSPRSQMDFTTSSPDVFKNIRPVVWLASLPAVWQPCWLWYHEGDMLRSALTYLYIPAPGLRYQSQSRTRLVHFPTAASFLAKSQTQIQTLAGDRGGRRRLSSLPTSSPFFSPPPPLACDSLCYFCVVSDKQKGYSPKFIISLQAASSL